MYYESLLDRLRRRPLDADEIDLYIAELVFACSIFWEFTAELVSR